MKTGTEKNKPTGRKAVLLALCGLLLLHLAGCGAAATEQTASVPGRATAGDAAAAEDTAPAMAGQEEAGLAAQETGELQPPEDGRKMILNAHLSLEALDFDAARSQLLAAAAQAGGYVEASSLSGSKTSGEVRSAYYSLRIPASQYSAFLARAGEVGNLLQLEESSEDITRQYIDVDARIKALRVQEARLLEMMEQAENIEDLLYIQAQLTEVQYQIESYTSTQRLYDDLVSYATVTVSLREVYTFTPPPPESYGDRALRALQSGWAGARDTLQQGGLLLLYGSPLLVLAAVGVAVALLLWRRGKKRRAAQAQNSAANAGTFLQREGTNPSDAPPTASPPPAAAPNAGETPPPPAESTDASEENTPANKP